MPAGLIRHAGLLCGPARTDIVSLVGTLRGSDSALSACYVGSGASLSFLRKHLFSTCEQRLLQSTTLPLLRHRRGPTAHDGRLDLTIFEQPPLWGLMPAPRPALRMPAWVSQVIHLPGQGAAPPSVLPRKLEREVARIARKWDFRVEISGDESTKSAFYHEFYLPHVSRRFGDAAVRVSERQFTARANDHHLAKLLQGDRWVAGVLLQRKGNELRFGWYGACMPPDVRGASEVLDAMVIEKAAAEGVRTIIFGHSRPSLADGVVRYKQRFGAQVRATRFPQAMLSLYVRRWSGQLAACLDEARFIGLKGALPFVHRLQHLEGAPEVTLAPL